MFPAAEMSETAVKKRVAVKPATRASPPITSSPTTSLTAAETEVMTERVGVAGGGWEE